MLPYIADFHIWRLILMEKKQELPSAVVGAKRRRRSPILWPKFSPELEAEYRHDLRRNARFGRAGLFLVFALIFGLNPLYQQKLFLIPDDLAPLMTLIRVGLVMPLMVAAIVVSLRVKAYRPLAQAVQSVAVLSVLTVLLVDRYLALKIGVNYPAEMLGLGLISFAFFSSFHFLRITLMSVAYTGIAVTIEFSMATPDSAPELHSFLLVLMAITAVGGAFNHESLSRWRWWHMTRLIQAKADLRKSDELFQSFMDYNPALSWMKNAQGVYTYISARYRRVLGLHEQDWRGRTAHDFFPPEYADHVRDLDRQVMESGEAHHSLGPVPGGERQDRQWQIARFLCTNGSGERFVGGVATDVTQLRRAEEAAQAAMRAKTEFLANMSHEIRTPMNAIVGMTSILLGSPQSAEQKEWTEVIRGSSEHLLSIINDILDFSKIEANRVELEERPFSLREGVESVLDLVAVSAASKDIEIAYIVHPGVPERINGDVARLRQVLLNLLSNAVKFTGERGEVSVEVRAKDDGDRHEIEFTVRDSGIGITAEQLQRLFEPFSQADASTMRAYGGTGLGLSISKRLVHLMGGRIWVESQPNHGSTFSFTIRVPAVAPDKDSAAEVASLRGKRAFIIADSDMNRRILREQCSAWGMSIAGSMSLKAACAHDPATWPFEPSDGVLIDSGFSEADARKLASRLRELQPASRLILFGAATAQAAAPERGIDAVLPKPIRPLRLQDVLLGLCTQGGKPAIAAPKFEMPVDMAREHPLRILVAEDNDVNQRVARLLLNRLGYKADFVADGQEAVMAIERQPYDVVLMDIQMPVMDGLAATREICRRYPPERRPRIVGVSASAMAEDRRDGERAGMDDYVTKPVLPAALVAALRKCRRLDAPASE